MELKISDTALEDLLRDAIRTRVIGAIGTPEMIGKLIDAALEKKRNTYGDYRSTIEQVCDQAIQEAARDILRRYIEDNRQALERTLVSSLDKHRDKIAVALIDGVLKNAEASWRFSVSLSPREPTE